MGKLKAMIASAMQRITKRRPGNSRLVYDKATRTIKVVSRSGATKPAQVLRITSDEADIFGDEGA